MARFRRTTHDEPPIAEIEPEPIGPAGKGRPTPKRSEARKARKVAVAPKTRKEAAAQLREKNRIERRKQRAALVTGDERELPPRDAGPVKRLVRDVVDSRFTYGQIFFGSIFFVIVLTAIPNEAALKAVANALILVTLLLMILDGYRTGRRAKALVEERYGIKETAGVTSYAVMRAMLPRRMRRPPPKVNRGDAI